MFILSTLTIRTSGRTNRYFSSGNKYLVLESIFVKCKKYKIYISVLYVLRRLFDVGYTQQNSRKRCRYVFIVITLPA
jgi:hypothetical protein